MYTFYDEIDTIFAALSAAEHGNMKLRGDSTDEDTKKNRRAICEIGGIACERLVGADLTHGKSVAIIDEPQDDLIKQTDALVTAQKDLYISVTVADCFPVFFYDPHAEVVGVAHAGWRGIVAEIIPRTMQKMQEIGAKSEDIIIEIGPGISQENFDFSYREMTSEFGHFAQDKYIKESSTIDRVKIDLRAMIKDQILHSDGNLDLLTISDVCTYDQENLFSARRHGGDSFNAMLAVIGMRN